MTKCEAHWDDLFSFYPYHYPYVRFTADQDGRKLGFGSMQGIPLIATSPVRHGEPSPGAGGGGPGLGGGSGAGGGGVGGGVNGGAPVGGMNAVEVHAFAPPWKALAEFALHNDLERIDPSAPHFQQLINQVAVQFQPSRSLLFAGRVFKRPFIIARSRATVTTRLASVPFFYMAGSAPSATCSRVNQ